MDAFRRKHSETYWFPVSYGDENLWAKSADLIVMRTLQRVAFSDAPEVSPGYRVFELVETRIGTAFRFEISHKKDKPISRRPTTYDRITGQSLWNYRFGPDAEEQFEKSVLRYRESDKWTEIDAARLIDAPASELPGLEVA
ncbi:hypothetical protein DS843_22650 [Roseomonas genomospecies 6]|uniref:Uncharacterized protein n=2 Tax=Roseomonas genomospecies 6 TaxID=214106 RepID=A0A9W7KQE3_9PROT|nr:hypothetical protein DS843_22650 [Roseomonas genomospecies 6]